MTDDLRNRGPADRSRVNVNEAWERSYWCGKFDCTEDELRTAVRTVGVMAADVERYINNNRRR